MSVCIKGMEMPNKCIDCRLLIWKRNEYDNRVTHPICVVLNESVKEYIDGKYSTADSKLVSEKHYNCPLVDNCTL